ncbi:MAG: translocation/assembly module TamB domain-containing protein [Proteobacteria bacterium]|nr:translocation/assembly module TamB domain-containing protein [Pseudomonadota bacterium]
MQSRLKILVIILVSCAMAAFAANLLVDNPYTHQLIRIAINDKLKQDTNLSLDFKAIKVQLIPPGLDLYGLAVAPALQQAQPLLTVAQVRAKISIWSLLMGKARLSSLDLNDLSLVWPPPWNFPGFLKEAQTVTREATKPATWPPSFDLPIDRLVIKNGQVFAELPNFKIPERSSLNTLSLVGLDAEITYKNWRHIGIELGIKSIDASVGAVSFLESTAVELHGDLVDRRLSIHQIQAKGERLNTDGSGHIDLLPATANSEISGITVALQSKIEGDFTLLGSFLDIADTYGPVTGTVAVTAEIPFTESGKASFKVNGQGQVQGAVLGGFGLFDSKAEFEIDDKSVRLPRIDFIVDGKNVGKLYGEIKIDDAINFDFHGKPSGLHLVDLFEALGVTNKDADLTLDSPDLRVHGTGFPLTIHVSANARAANVVIPALGPPVAAYPKSPVCQTHLAIEVTSTQVDFTGSTAVCAAIDGSHASPATVSGGITFGDSAAINVRVKSTALDLALGEYFVRVPLAGTAASESFIHGPLNHVLVDSKTSASKVAVLRIPLGEVEAQTQVDALTVKWDHIHIKPEAGGMLEASHGQIDLGVYGYPLSSTLMALDVTSDTVQSVVKAAGLEQDFSFSIAKANGDFNGLIAKPLASTNAHLNFTLKDATLGEETLFDSADGMIKSDAHGWSSPSIVLSLDLLNLKAKFNHERIAGHGPAANNTWVNLGLGAKDRFNLSFQTMAPPPVAKNGAQEEPIDNLSSLPFAGQILAASSIRGEIEAQGDLSGTVEDIQGTFTTSLNQISVLGSGMANINGRGFIHGQHVDLVLDQGGNALEGRLSLDLLQRGVPFDWYFSCNRMDLRLLGTTYFSSDPRNYLYLSGDWRLHGTFADWWHAQGELNIKDLRANYVQNIGAQTKTLALRQDKPTKLLFTSTGWHFEDNHGLLLSGADLQLGLTTSDSHPPERLGFKFASVLDINLAKEFFREVETAEGKISINGELLGPTSDPRPQVVISDLKPTAQTAAGWKPLSIGIADIRPAFRNISLNVIYRDGHIIIDRFGADKGTGSLHASGSLNVASAASDESHLDLNLNDATLIFPVAFLKSFETQMSGNLVISGQGLPLKVAGDVVINRARSTREVDIRDEIINALRQKSIGSALIQEKPIVTLDLNVSASKSINIHNRNLQAKLSSDLHIKGTDIAPIVSGQIEVNKGKFIYKQEFNITRGLVTFDDPIKPDPSLDILALSEVDTYRVYIAVNGRASDPTVEFSIDPPTRETGTPISKLDILVLLSSGKLPEEARVQGQDSQNAATSEAANLILGQFEEPMEKLLESSGQSVVRSVYFDTHPAPDGSPVPRINLPVDLGDNIDFVLRTDQVTSEVSLEYNVNESIAVSGVREISHAKDQQPTQTTPGEIEGDSKVNLKFRFSFE